jgi:hypothetical protein
MDSILNNLKQEFKQGTILNKLIYLNVGVFLLFSILGVFSFMFQFNLSPVLDQLYLPAENSKLLINLGRLSLICFSTMAFCICCLIWFGYILQEKYFYNT